MDRFKYFEDFDNLVQHSFLCTRCQEMYIIAMQIVQFRNLEEEYQKYIQKNKSIVHEIDGLTEIVKIHSSASFYYKNVSDKINCERITNQELFGNKIFPVILYNDLKSILERQEKNGWHSETNASKNVIIIANKKDEKVDIPNIEFKYISDLYEEFVSNSLNGKNKSLKETNSFVERFRKENFECNNEKFTSGFQPSLEKTFINAVHFIYKEYCTKEDSQIKLVCLFRLTANDDPTLAWTNYQHLGEFISLNNYEFEKKISNKISDYYFFNSEKNINVKVLTVPIGFSINHDYFLIIPITKGTKRIQFRYALVLMATYPLKMHILDNINGLIREYFYNYLEDQKRNKLLELQRKLFDKSVDFGQNTQNGLIELTKETFKTLVQITSAYSATFRLFDPSTNSLVKLVNILNDEAGSYTEYECPSINLDEYRYKSLNCRTFLLMEGDNCALYLPNIIKENKKKFSKEKEIKRRKYNEQVFESIPARSKTLSELCVPFYYQGVVIGVMNFESPIIRAFDNECKHEYKANKGMRVKYHNAKNKDLYVKLQDDSFIYTIKSALQHFYCFLRERNDIKHLSRLIDSENNLHELKNLVDSGQDLNPFRNTIKEQLYSSTILPTSNNEFISVSKILFETRSICIDAYYELLGNFPDIKKSEFLEEKHLNTYLPIKVNKNICLNSQTTNSIKTIYKNLLRNYFNHGGIIINDILSVRYVTVSGILTITQVFNEPLEKKNEWFVSPYMNENIISSGLFIVGTYVRQLGGHVFTKYDEYERLKQFDIYINLKELGGDKNES